jgi:hypothetical protein
MTLIKLHKKDGKRGAGKGRGVISSEFQAPSSKLRALQNGHAG